MPVLELIEVQLDSATMQPVPFATGHIAVPPRLVHPALWGRVDFIQYPLDTPTNEPTDTQDNLTRLFVGQLPLTITEDQINFALRYTTGCVVFYTERICKRGHPTGCVHAYCPPRDADRLLRVPQRVLYDEEGFWVPRDQEQMNIIRQYGNWLSERKDVRPVLFPFQPMTIEPARSSFIPPYKYTGHK